MRLAGDVIRDFELLPLVRAGDSLATSKIMILSPHPDDESLGCGGLIAACCAAGTPPIVVMLTDGAASHPESFDYPPDSLTALRQQEALAAVQILGLPPENLVFLGYPDAALPVNGLDFAEAVGRMAAIAAAQACQIIIGPWAQDPHADHMAGASMAQTLAAQLGLPLWSYPVWGWLIPPETALPMGETTGFRLDISEFLPTKQAAIAAHRSQYGGLITDAPHGFSLPPNLLAIAARSYEVFIHE